MDYKHLEMTDFNFEFGLQEMENQENYFDCYYFDQLEFHLDFALYMVK